MARLQCACECPQCLEETAKEDFFNNLSETIDLINSTIEILTGAIKDVQNRIRWLEEENRNRK